MNRHIAKCVWLGLHMLAAVCQGQVTNNQIEHRVRLHLDSGWHSSATTHSNVEWDCINRNLTARCLVYHNDQWFTFRPGTSGPLYLNVARQRCRKLYGVQMVVLEGDPCKTNSYLLRKCIPFTDQSDFFVRLDSLDRSQEYLVNIDGYLGDECTFDIAFSSTSHGTPVSARNHNLPVTLVQRDSVVLLDWIIDDTLAFEIREFQVYRKKEDDRKAQQLNVPLIRNAYGVARRVYSVIDTLRREGRYMYTIYGVTSHDFLLLSTTEVNFSRQPRSASIMARGIQYKRAFEYYVKKDGMVSVNVLDASSEKRLFTTSRRATRGKNVLLLDFRSQIDNGVFAFNIIVEGRDLHEVYTVKFEPASKK